MNFYARKQNASRVFAIIRASVRPSVRLSVHHTRELYQNGASKDHEIFTVGCPKVSSLSWQNFVPLGAWVPSNEGVKEGYPPKKDVILPLLARIMWKRLQIGTYMLFIITSTGDRLLGFINIDDLERPQTPQKQFFSEFFCNFWMQCTFQHWIATKWLEIDQDNLHMKFSAFNVDFSSSSPNPLGSRRLAQAGVKDSYPPKKWLFYRNYHV